MTITVRQRSGSKRRARRTNHASGLGEAIVNGRDGEHAPDSGPFARSPRNRRVRPHFGHCREATAPQPPFKVEERRIRREGHAFGPRQLTSGSLLLYANTLDTFNFRLAATVALAAKNEGPALQNREGIQQATDRRGAQ